MTGSDHTTAQTTCLDSEMRPDDRYIITHLITHLITPMSFGSPSLPAASVLSMSRRQA